MASDEPPAKRARAAPAPVDAAAALRKIGPALLSASGAKAAKAAGLLARLVRGAAEDAPWDAFADALRPLLAAEDLDARVAAHPRAWADLFAAVEGCEALADAAGVGEAALLRTRVAGELRATDDTFAFARACKRARAFISSSTGDDGGVVAALAEAAVRRVAALAWTRAPADGVVQAAARRRAQLGEGACERVDAALQALVDATRSAGARTAAQERHAQKAVGGSGHAFHPLHDRR